MHALMRPKCTHPCHTISCQCNMFVRPDWKHMGRLNRLPMPFCNHAKLSFLQRASLTSLVTYEAYSRKQSSFYFCQWKHMYQRQHGIACADGDMPPQCSLEASAKKTRSVSAEVTSPRVLGGYRPLPETLVIQDTIAHKRLWPHILTTI